MHNRLFSLAIVAALVCFNGLLCPTPCTAQPSASPEFKIIGPTLYPVMDVTGDGLVDDKDVAAITACLNVAGCGGRTVPETQFLDVNGDGFITPLDALAVINYIHSVQNVDNVKNVDSVPKSSFTFECLAEALKRNGSISRLSFSEQCHASAEFGLPNGSTATRNFSCEVSSNKGSCKVTTFLEDLDLPAEAQFQSAKVSRLGGSFARELRLLNRSACMLNRTPGEYSVSAVGANPTNYSIHVLHTFRCFR